jgi:hypothetical protein
MVDNPPTRATHGPSPGFEPEHRQAICDEIGEQLRSAFADDAAPLPPRLEGLVQRLTESDGGAPSIAPDHQDDPASLPLWKRLLSFWRVL